MDNLRATGWYIWVIVIALLFSSRSYGNDPVFLNSSDLDESSGLAVSLYDPNLIWTHNDSGSQPYLYLFDRSTGGLRGIFELINTRAVDWEDMCAFESGGKRFLAIGDIGDNSRRRKQILVHIIEEPLPPPLSVITNSGETQTAIVLPIRNKLTLEIVYPDGAVDCEALAFDSENSRLLLLTKELFRCRVFSVPLEENRIRSISAGGSQNPIQVKAEYVQTLGIPLVTAADLCPEGQRLAVCTYGPAYLLTRDGLGWSQRTMTRIKLPNRRQGEAIAFAGPDTLLVTSEFAPTPLWTVKILSQIVER